MKRSAVVIGLGWLAVLGLAACASGQEVQAQPAQDQPTFVWIFSDP